jgi:hypothetical protein
MLVKHGEARNSTNKNALDVVTSWEKQTLCWAGHGARSMMLTNQSTGDKRSNEVHLTWSR